MPEAKAKPCAPPSRSATQRSKAQRVGLSRTEYLRRALARERDTQASTVCVADLDKFADTFADLDDPEVMGGAWR